MTRNGQVLEFRLGEETYCVSIDVVTEIVDVGEVTSVPNAPAHVQGVMDLRGRTTAIVDPRVVFDLDTETDPRRIVVFDPDVVEDQSAAGWLVDEVHQVVDADPETLDETAVADDDSLKGVRKRDDGSFVIWVDPQAVHAAG